MKIKTAYLGYLPLHTQYRIEQSHELTPSGLTPLQFSPETNLYLSPLARLVLSQQALPLTQQPMVKESEEVETKSPRSLEDLVKSASAAGIVPAAMKMYQLGNTTKKAELVQVFTTNNFTPHAADSLADKVLEIVKSPLGKSAFIGIAGGSLVFSVLEVIKPRWTWQRKLIIAIGVGVLLAILYLVLARLGIVT